MSNLGAAPMLRKLCLAICVFVLPTVPVAAAVEIVGAGATFPAPVIELWAKQFAKESGTTVSYRPVGSGEGIRRVTARVADFAMTDVPLTQAELLQDDLMQFPVIVGGVVPVMNVPGIEDGALRLTGKVLADIFLGRITRWDDPALAALNPGLRLPGLPIKVVHRADGSGTSFVFTYYLSKSSPEWRERLGIGSRLVWPTGDGAPGNEGVAETVRDTTGAIGYVEYAYALQQHLVGTALLDAAGKYVRVNEAAVRAAASAARWSRAGYYEILIDREGEGCWPIVGISYALVHKKQASPEDGAATLSFLEWVYAHGAGLAGGLHYVTLDDASLIGRIESSWSEIHDEQGQPVWKRR